MSVIRFNKSAKTDRSRSPSINNEANDSPHIIKENENIDLMEKDIINEIRGKTIPLNEEEENNETSSYKNKNAIEF